MRIVLCVVLLAGAVALARGSTPNCLEIRGAGSLDRGRPSICWDLARPTKLGSDIVQI